MLSTYNSPRLSYLKPRTPPASLLPTYVHSVRYRSGAFCLRSPLSPLPERLTIITPPPLLEVFLKGAGTVLGLERMRGQRSND